MPFRRRDFLLPFAFLAALTCNSAHADTQAAADGSLFGPPRVDGISPSAGMGTGGDRITLEGANFVPSMKVWLGHAACGDVHLLSRNELECISSPHSAGTVDLLVKTRQAFLLHRKAFTYIPALRLTPSEPLIAISAKVTFQAQGGDPPYQYSVVKGTSYIDGSSGVLSASGNVEVGVVRATDSDGHTTETGYEVVFPLQVFPDASEIPVDHSVVITAFGGAPPYQYRLMSGPGRFIPDRRIFVAPSSPGKSVVRVTDAAQNSQEVTITTQPLSPLPPHVIAVGDGFSCAAPTGAVSCWGTNANQQLGNIRFKSVDVSTPLPDLQTGVTSIVSGMHHTCVLVDGGVKCWGGNEYGQLGDGSRIASATPRQVIGLESGVLAIAAGDFHTCAALANSVVCWGRNDSGQLGDGTAAQSSVPVSVVGVDGLITAIAAGASHTCAVMNGMAKCWGRNRNGELGTGNRIDRWTAVPVAGMSFGVQTISAGRGHTCAVTTSGLKCWGYNGTGNLGASTAADKIKPYDVQVAAPLSVLASRQYHSCGIASGQLYCWGYNYQGEVGDSSELNRWAPVLVNGFSGPVRDVATASFHSCAVLSDNQIYCWGDDYFGELGDGGTSRQTVPVRVITEAERREIRRKQRLQMRAPRTPLREKGDTLQ